MSTRKASRHVCRVACLATLLLMTALASPHAASARDSDSDKRSNRESYGSGGDIFTDAPRNEAPVSPETSTRDEYGIPRPKDPPGVWLALLAHAPVNADNEFFPVRFGFEALWRVGHRFFLGFQLGGTWGRFDQLIQHPNRPNSTSFTDTFLLATGSLKFVWDILPRDKWVSPFIGFAAGLATQAQFDPGTLDDLQNLNVLNKIKGARVQMSPLLSPSLGLRLFPHFPVGIVLEARFDIAIPDMKKNVFEYDFFQTARRRNVDAPITGMLLGGGLILNL